MLPRPSLSFTLPSISDNTKLDCRVFHPPSLCGPSHSNVPWSGHVAVVAHPYAPLGGCFNDPIVDVVAGTLLQLGFLVATFNFRGAASSQGRTSWTSKPEQADYISVVGFLAYYVHNLDGHVDRHELPIMLIAGYSYGALVATRLPPLDAILAYFAAPAIHTAAADIRLRAQYLAEMRNSHPCGSTVPRKSSGIRVGGDEDIQARNNDRNPTPEFQQEEGMQENVRDLLSRTKLVYRRSSCRPCESEVNNEINHYLDKVEGGIAFQSAYLAVSPPVGFVTGLATMSFPNPWPSWIRRSRQDRSLADDALFTSNPTFVIYGNRDGFITHRKIREWTQRLSGVGSSQFRFLEVPGAGHFWTEPDVIYQLRNAIGAFAIECTRRRATPVPALRTT